MTELKGNEFNRNEFDALPHEADVVVIGGGIVGMSTALELALKGVSVVVCEKGDIGEEQSNRNWGWVRKMGRDPREIPLMIRAMELWDGLAQVTGRDTGFRRYGTTYFVDRESDLSRYEGWMKAAEPYGLDTRFVGGAEIGTFIPDCTRTFGGGLHTASDGFAEPHLATRAIAEGVRLHGGRVVTTCAVRGIEMAGGRVHEVVTELGRVRCQSVVLAGGSWSALFAASLGVRMPQQKLLSQVQRTRPLPGGPEGCGSGPGFGFRKRLDGGFNFSMRSAHPVDIVPDSLRNIRLYVPALKNEWRAMKFRIGRQSALEAFTARKWSLDEPTVFERYRVLRPEPSRKVLDAALVNIKSMFPQWKDIQVNQRMGTFIDVTPDAIPVISGVDAIPGFHIATGFSGHGFGIAPAAGEMMAQIVMGETPAIDPAPFRHSRFIDGSPINHWPIGF
ncbi:FAD-binding oxidoreductase [Poseidonocella sp. HB161398]|uniref:NAD(P)/FAD-dependent oxidoreductase n=1 Tax=Poseidonocella sp. HB161398 TaxID=2320855 RepID=UPI00110841A1|nr:FAD-binding oxidoreductase [Poseidonocella sp. HB161398]